MPSRPCGTALREWEYTGGSDRSTGEASRYSETQARLLHAPQGLRTRCQTSSSRSLHRLARLHLTRRYLTCRDISDCPYQIPILCVGQVLAHHLHRMHRSDYVEPLQVATVARNLLRASLRCSAAFSLLRFQGTPVLLGPARGCQFSCNHRESLARRGTALPLLAMRTAAIVLGSGASCVLDPEYRRIPLHWLKH